MNAVVVVGIGGVDRVVRGREVRGGRRGEAGRGTVGIDAVRIVIWIRYLNAGFGVWGRGIGRRGERGEGGERTYSWGRRGGRLEDVSV